jgi:membrane protein required for beta-lactamase induction
MSFWAILGAAIGAAFGIASALVVVSAVSERLRALDRSQNPQERAELERKIVLLRWIVVSIDAIVFAIIGYWVGTWLA